MRHFNMGRWNDEDNFLTNYVGRQQEISATHDYWVSRFKGFFWATVFSTHSEISPLGEAGIGNEGGWTYPIGDCHRPCTQYNPRTWKTTNNTGWVDFIVTPTLGSAWMVAEDTIDRLCERSFAGRQSKRDPSQSYTGSALLLSGYSCPLSYIDSRSRRHRTAAVYFVSVTRCLYEPDDMGLAGRSRGQFLTTGPNPPFARVGSNGEA
jgi:hypothetical protein